MISQLNKFIKIFLLFLGISTASNCLSYWKKEFPHDKKLLSSEVIPSEIKYGIDTSFEGSDVIFSLKTYEIKKRKNQFTQEVAIKKSISNESGKFNYGTPEQPDIGNGKCFMIVAFYNCQTKSDYWLSMLFIPGYGIGYIFTLPIMIYDWTTLPFRTIDETRVDQFEEIENLSTSEISGDFSKLKLTSNGKMSTFDLERQKVRIPFSRLSLNTELIKIEAISSNNLVLIEENIIPAELSLSYIRSNYKDKLFELNESTKLDYWQAFLNERENVNVENRISYSGDEFKFNAQDKERYKNIRNKFLLVNTNLNSLSEYDFESKSFHFRYTLNSHVGKSFGLLGYEYPLVQTNEISLPIDVQLAKKIKDSKGKIFILGTIMEKAETHSITEIIDNGVSFYMNREDAETVFRKDWTLKKHSQVKDIKLKQLSFKILKLIITTEQGEAFPFLSL
ncbi:hypothetical protein [Leptospira levettii]|uniref:hypothetical protein n=1 Tax=Leptospira levettii TaxID=2023178 RepID=UPI000C295D6F|nr:hypothetical protein [Leptospira levettii]PJZ89053.1 hypothetical protein CH368_08485 [Leptospira levettii]